MLLNYHMVHYPSIQMIKYQKLKVLRFTRLVLYDGLTALHYEELLNLTYFLEEYF